MLLKLSKRASCAALAVVAALLAPLAVQAAPDPVPIEAFFQPAKMRMPRLSPSGRWLAVLTSLPGRRVGLNMLDLEGREASRFIDVSSSADVGWFTWVSDDWLIFSVDDSDMRSETPRAQGLMTVRRDGSASRMLVSRNYGTTSPVAQGGILTWNHEFIGFGAPGSNEIVLGEIMWDVRHEFSHLIPKAVNVATGGTRTIQRDAPKGASWWLDAQGQLRAATIQEGGDILVMWSDGPGKPWRQISKAPMFKRPFTLAYVDDQGLMVHTWDKSGHSELRRLDLETGKPMPEVIVATPGFDGAMRPIFRGSSGHVDGLRLWVDGQTTVWFSSAMQEIQAEADAALPGRLNIVSCQPCDNPKAVLVASYSDRSAGDFLIYRPQQKKWQLIGSSRPDIDEKRMAHLSFVRTKARDGLDLPVWVTRPIDGADKVLPAVVLVHEGPNRRGTYWGWNPEAQFLASRGYVVIEPEFRGTHGYSTGHFRAGWKQWGLAMQDDVTDAVKFAAGQGWVDPARICIMGFGYGGYAALMGLVKDPDQYRCGVAGMAVSDPRNLFTMHWSAASQSSREFRLPTLVGDPVKDLVQFIATSPVEQASKIKAPLLLMHGEKDAWVPFENAERMREALKKNGKEFDWLAYPDEGHGLRRTDNRIDFWRRVEAFLGKHLKPGEGR